MFSLRSSALPAAFAFNEQNIPGAHTSLLWLKYNYLITCKQENNNNTKQNKDKHPLSQ